MSLRTLILVVVFSLSLMTSLVSCLPVDVDDIKDALKERIRQVVDDYVRQTKDVVSEAAGNEQDKRWNVSPCNAACFVQGRWKGGYCRRGADDRSIVCPRGYTCICER